MNTHQHPCSSPGLGLTWFAQLPELLAQRTLQADFFELDVHAGSADLAADPAATALTHTRVLRTSHMPVASTTEFSPLQAQACVQAVQRLNPSWLSAPLGFMQASACAVDGSGLHAGLALPPLQCPASVLGAVRRIEQLRRLSGRPVAFHIVPNHLKPQPGEMPDGEFYASVADAAGCGIDLDLHTLLRHERYGRARLRDVMARLPLRRVWQLRVGAATLAQVTDLLAEWLPALPQLRSLVLDATPVSAAGELPEARPLAAHMATLQRLWATRGSKVQERPRAPRSTAQALPYAEGPACTVEGWERALACLANHRIPPRGSRPPASLLTDPGLALHRQHIEAERTAVLARHLPLTWCVLGASLAPMALQSLLHEFWRLHGPEPVARDEVQHFTDCLHRALAKGRLAVPHLRNVLQLDTCSRHSDSVESQVHFDAEPLLVLAALARGRAPAAHAAG